MIWCSRLTVKSVGRDVECLHLSVGDFHALRVEMARSPAAIASFIVALILPNWASRSVMIRTLAFCDWPDNGSSTAPARRAFRQAGQVLDERSRRLFAASEAMAHRTVHPFSFASPLRVAASEIAESFLALFKPPSFVCFAADPYWKREPFGAVNPSPAFESSGYDLLKI